MRVDFYFGPGSRYSYLASTRLAALAARTGAAFRWRPVFSPDLMRAAGLPTLSERPTQGQYDRAYREQDVRRWAALYAVPHRGDPSMSADQWRRIAHALAAAGEQVERFAKALFEAAFARGEPPRSDAEIVRIAARAGIEDLRIEAGAQLAQGILEEAVARGVFGVPTFVAGDDLFFGNDRLPILEHHLKTKAAA